MTPDDSPAYKVPTPPSPLLKKDHFFRSTPSGIQMLATDNTMDANDDNKEEEEEDAGIIMENDDVGDKTESDYRNIGKIKKLN